MRVAQGVAWLLLSIVFNLCWVAASEAEIPNKSPEKLQQVATHVVVGDVERIYKTVQKTSSHFEHTYSVAEVTIGEVKKGGEVVAGDRIFVRFWRKRWIGKGRPAPDHYGHRGVPKEGEQATIYLKGSRQNGYDVVSPNGFAVRGE